MPKPIDPEALLKLINQRQHDGGVTLSFPTMLQIVENLRRANALVAKLEQADAAQGAHPHQQWADAKAALVQLKEASQ